MSLEDEVAGLRAKAHPIRLRMLSLLTGADLSAAELARELDITQANASYHLRALERTGEIRVVGEESVRGGRAKKYRYPGVAHDRAGRRVRDTDGFEVYAEAAHHELIRRLRDWDREGRAVSADAEVWLDPDSWKRALDLVKQASRLVHEKARPPHEPGSVHVNFQTTLFQMRDGRDQQQ